MSTQQLSISHDFGEETQEAKARWFQSLTRKERMGMLCAFTDMILSVNPSIMEQKDVEPVEITIFRDKVRIDVQTSTPGLDFEQAWAEREEMNYEGQIFYVVSRQHLILSKRAAGRERDLEDIRLLELGKDQ